MLHNSWGVGLAEQAFGLAFTRASDGVELAVRPIVERHIQREMGTIPTLDAALEGVTLQRWMCSRAMPAVEQSDAARRASLKEDEMTETTETTTSYRRLSAEEIILLGQQWENYQRWERVREYVTMLYPPDAHEITISVTSEYNDSSYDDDAHIIVTDHDGELLSFDFSRPWWSQFDTE